MAVQITDELRLLIIAEAQQALKELGAYQDTLSAVDREHAKVSGSANNATKAVEKETKAVKDAKGIAGEASKETGKYAGNLNDVDDAQTRAASSAGGFKNALKTVIGPVATVGAAVALTKKLLFDSVEAFGQSQGEARKFSVTYRDVAEDARVAAATWANTFDYAESTAQAVLGSAGDIYTGMGMTSKGALDLAAKTTYLAGALVKFNPQLGDAADATQALISAQNGEREALKRYGVIVSEATVAQKLLLRGQQNLTGSALLAAKAQAVLDIAYEQSPNALAAVNSGSELLLDTNRRLSEVWKEHQELGGQVVAGVWQPIKSAVADYIATLNEAKKAELEAMRVDPNTSAIQQFDKTADRIENLVKNYEELKRKSNLNVDEQARLKNILSEIASAIPTAVTAWDKYGNAVSISTVAAQEFADKQRELRVAELEYQQLRLQVQQSNAQASYQENKASLDSTQKEIDKEKEKVAALQAEYKIAKDLGLILSSTNPDTGGYIGAIKYLEQNTASLRGTMFELTKVRFSSSPFDYLLQGSAGVVERYDKVNARIASLNTELQGYRAGMKEYDVITAQIRAAEAELQFLLGNTRPLIDILEDQIRNVPELSAQWRLLQKEFRLGSMGADDYTAALQSLLAQASRSADIGTPDTSKWDAFRSSFLDGLGLDRAIEFQVEISPIVDPDGGRAQMEEELGYYGEMINKLWSNRAQFDSLAQWKTALDQLVDKYNDVKDKVDAKALLDSTMSENEKALKQYDKTMSDANELFHKGLLAPAEYARVAKDAWGTFTDNGDWQKRTELLAEGMTRQARAQTEIADLQAEINRLQEEGLLTAEDGSRIIKSRRDDLAEELGIETSKQRFLQESWETMKENYFSFQALSSLAVDTFTNLGEAMASGADIGSAARAALGAYISDLLGSISTMAIGAGLRLIAEGGWAGVPAAIALFAIGGITGIAGGLLGGSGKGIDSDIQDSVAQEIELRKSLNDTLKDQLQTEEQVLRRQWDRNLISSEEYVAGMQDINQQNNQGTAQAGALGLLDTKLSALDSKLSGMTEWDKFWSNKDENIKATAKELEVLAGQINSASTAAELKALIAELEKYGIDTSALPAFATGGSFITRGPQPVLLGDNSSGRELVRVTPLDANEPVGGTASQQVVNIYGDVYGIEDLYGKLEKAGMKVKRKKLA